MASDDTLKSPSMAALAPSTGYRSRRGSTTSISTASHIDKEQLAQTLNKIHTSASQSGSLTTFNDYASPPGTLPVAENKGLAAGDLVQNGFSGLYNRLKEAVGAAPVKVPEVSDDNILDAGPKRTTAGSTTSLSARGSVASMPRGDAATTNSSTGTGGLTDGLSSGLTTSGANTNMSDSQIHQLQSSKGTTISSMSASRSSGGRASFSNQKAQADGLGHSAVSPTMTHRDSGQSSVSADYPPTRSSGRRSISKPNSQSTFPAPESMKKYDRDLSISTDRAQGSSRPRRDDGISLDGSLDSPLSPVKAAAAPPLPTLQTDLRHVRTPSGASSLLTAPRRPAVIERISRSRSPHYAPSASSSVDPGAAEPSPINTSAHNSLYHESFGQETQQQMLTSGAMRIPGTTNNEGAPEEVNARLEAMRKQILSKEFWMADETCKECFSCGQPFSAFRRKHHCRVCGFIFDSKCTSIISAQKFGMPGTLRLCKPCLRVLNQRIEGSGSDDSEDDSFLPAIFRPNQAKAAAPKISHTEAEGEEPSFAGIMEDLDDARSISTPMMAIPATRRIDDSNRRSAILEIDAPQLSRPSSSRSLRSMTTGRPQSSGLGHKRHHSRQNFWSRFKPAPENAVPFRQDPSDEMARKPKYPAFHEDNIIDPELAAYMSDESSGDEQMSIFATMSNSDLQPSSFDREKGNFGPFLGGSRKHRFRGGEKSISGLSFTSRGMDDSAPGNLPSLGRPSRRRNLSNVSASVHHHMRSPRPKSSAFNKGPSASHDNIFAENHAIEATKLTRSDSLQEDKEPQVELNSSSMQHVRKLLRQLLEDSEIPNAPAWEKALIPILLQCTDDVVPDVRAGDDMDVRHYVKLKKIPGGKPGDTAYVSGVIFTKNLALKSMPRRILNPRIVLVSFPIEYQRQQQHFMSLQPVIEQEKEFLRVVVNRIINLRPQVLLCEKSVSGVALQYLSEANIAVAYNVKPSVISAVSRCAETDIITSLDRLALQNQAGRSAGFEVKTYVNKNYPGKKKTYIFLSGCAEQLGCTIALRGDSTEVLARMKRITEFMVYVVYNLKLETCLMRDEFIQLPAEGESSSLQSSTRQLPEEQNRSFSVSGEPSQSTGTPQETSADSEQPVQPSLSASVSGSVTGSAEQPEEGIPRPPEPVRTVSLHASHMSSPDAHVPEDVPMPTYYSDMVARYETKILSASPFVKFAQPYLLMKAREQERRLIYLKRLRDQDVVEEETGSEKKTQKFQLIKPEMVHAIGQKAPRQIMEVLHAVHDAEYDKALHNYQTQTRQWENYIQGNLDLFDPYSHQNIVVLYSEICTETKIPCAEPGLIAISFYDQHVDSTGSMDADCTLGNYIELLCLSKDSICTANGCDRAMTEHHRTYVHDESRITVFVEPAAIKPKHTTDDITMWSYCKICKKDSPTMPMSDSTWNYSFGKYLELLFWSKHLKLHDSTECPHDHRDHIRLFQFRDTWVRIHYDPIDLLEIIVPRARITWKVDNDLKLKNDIFAKIEARWIRFMASVKVRLKTITVDSVLPEKAEDCKTEVERLTKKTQDDQIQLIRRLQETYVNSKYYEVIPFNAVIREMLEAAGEWDTIFNQFEAYFLPDKDLRQLTMIQLKKIFSDNDSRESLPTTEGSTSTAETGEPPSQTFSETDEKMSTQPTDVSEATPSEGGAPQEEQAEPPKVEEDTTAASNEGALERTEPLDLATPSSPAAVRPAAGPLQQEAAPPAALTEQSSTSLAGPSESNNTSQETSVPGTTLSEKVEQLRREHQALNAEAAAKSENASELARPIPERTSSRKSGLTVSPPLVRATSQPIRTLQKSQAASFRGLLKDQKAAAEEAADKSTDSSFKVDKKISERLGLGPPKGPKKPAPSSIPRFVHKKKESKVFAIAKHFEQLSREFEKERIRENRKKRLAQQPRAFLPRTSTKAIVEVYDDVDDAVQEQEPMEDEPPRDTRQDPEPAPPALHTAHTAPVIPTVTDDSETPAESAETTQPEPQASGDTDDAATANASQGGSDDEGGASDTENGLDDILPDVKELADALEPSTEIPLELPKHQKKSLMKMLTNFWAERSASGWPLLEYPVNQGDHIFIDSDIIVREDEPSSVIAFALSSDDYCAKLADIRRSWQIAIQKTHEAGHADSRSSGLSDTGGEFTVDEGELEKSLLRATGTHLKYQFKEGSATMLCKIFYAEQFDALRRKCGVADRIIESLSRCLKWDSKGGKTKSVFLKTLDDRLVLKALSPVETSAFLRFAPAYFGIMAEALFHDLPSVIAKMLGFFQLIIKNPVTGVEIKLDLLVMENLFYDRSPSRIFDLKGSMRNRKIQSTGEQNEVLLDENMVEFIYESPLFAREHSKKLLRASVWNDTLFLARQNVMDYSLMIAVDEIKKELVVGIIDCIRTYTWDKKLESWIKDRGFAGGGRNRPTVTSPKEYKSRFREAMARYILQAPNCWHQFGSPQMINALRPRFEIEGKPE